MTTTSYVSESGSKFGIRDIAYSLLLSRIPVSSNSSSSRISVDRQVSTFVLASSAPVSCVGRSGAYAVCLEVPFIQTRDGNTDGLDTVDMWTDILKRLRESAATPSDISSSITSSTSPLVFTDSSTTKANVRYTSPSEVMVVTPRGPPGSSFRVHGSFRVAANTIAPLQGLLVPLSLSGEDDHNSIATIRGFKIVPFDADAYASFISTLSVGDRVRMRKLPSGGFFSSNFNNNVDSGGDDVDGVIDSDGSVVSVRGGAVLVRDVKRPWVDGFLVSRDGTDILGDLRRSSGGRRGGVALLWLSAGGGAVDWWQPSILQQLRRDVVLSLDSVLDARMASSRTRIPLVVSDYIELRSILIEKKDKYANKRRRGGGSLVSSSTKGKTSMIMTSRRTSHLQELLLVLSSSTTSIRHNDLQLPDHISVTNDDNDATVSFINAISVGAASPSFLSQGFLLESKMMHKVERGRGKFVVIGADSIGTTTIGDRLLRVGYTADSAKARRSYRQYFGSGHGFIYVTPDTRLRAVSWINANERSLASFGSDIEDMATRNTLENGDLFAQVENDNENKTPQKAQQQSSLLDVSRNTSDDASSDDILYAVDVNDIMDRYSLTESPRSSEVRGGGARRQKDGRFFGDRLLGDVSGSSPGSLISSILQDSRPPKGRLPFRSLKTDATFAMWLSRVLLHFDMLASDTLKALDKTLVSLRDRRAEFRERMRRRNLDTVMTYEEFELKLASGVRGKFFPQLIAMLGALIIAAASTASNRSPDVVFAGVENRVVVASMRVIRSQLSVEVVPTPSVFNELIKSSLSAIERDASVRNGVRSDTIRRFLVDPLLSNTNGEQEEGPNDANANANANDANANELVLCEPFHNKVWKHMDDFRMVHTSLSALLSLVSDEGMDPVLPVGGGGIGGDPRVVVSVPFPTSLPRHSVNDGGSLSDKGVANGSLLAGDLATVVRHMSTLVASSLTNLQDSVPPQFPLVEDFRRVYAGTSDSESLRAWTDAFEEGSERWRSFDGVFPKKSIGPESRRRFLPDGTHSLPVVVIVGNALDILRFVQLEVAPLVSCLHLRLLNEKDDDDDANNKSTGKPNLHLQRYRSDMDDALEQRDNTDGRDAPLIVSTRNVCSLICNSALYTNIRSSMNSSLDKDSDTEILQRRVASVIITVCVNIMMEVALRFAEGGAYNLAVTLLGAWEDISMFGRMDDVDGDRQLMDEEREVIKRRKIAILENIDGEDRDFLKDYRNMRGDKFSWDDVIRDFSPSGSGGGGADEDMFNEMSSRIGMGSMYEEGEMDARDMYWEDDNHNWHEVETQ